jgi:HAE1 family hydrophobic/amphiphilic exporter-1
VLRFDPANRPIFSLALTSPDGSQSTQALTTYADQILRKRLENVEGVGSVNLVGGLKRQINVYLRPDALDALGLRAEQIAATVRTENQDQPAGSVRTRDRERVVQIDARLRTVEDFRRLVVATRNDQPIRLSQVADVVDGPQEIETLALLNGQRTLALEVLKSQGDNTLDVVTGLRAAITEITPSLPPGMKLDVVRDSSRPIRVSVQTVRATLIEGALLTIIIVFLFLNSWRSTVITGLTLPISIIGTFLFMQMFGFSLNMVTLMALSLCVGLLIDDAIVVRENIVRHLQMGKSALQASIDGTQEIGLAVLATTLSIVAVFLPIGFMGGVIGKFFHEFGITIVAAVLISMFVSFTLDPMLSSIWHDPAIGKHGQPPGSTAPRSWYDRTFGRLTGAVDRWSESLSHGYQHLLGRALDHPWWTMVLAGATLVGSLALMPLVGTEFVPKADYSETFVNFYTPSGTSIEATEARTREVEHLIRQMPEVDYTLSTINTGQALGRNQVSVYVRLTDRHLRQRNVDQLSAPLRQALSAVPGVTVTHVGLLDAVAGLKPIMLSIQGSNLKELERLNREALALLRPIPGLVDLDTSLKADKPTLDIRVRRDAAADLGLNVNAVSQALSVLVEGKVVGSWRGQDEQNYDIRVSLHPDARRTADDLRNLTLVVGTDAQGRHPSSAPEPGRRCGRRRRPLADQPPRPQPRNRDHRQLHGPLHGRGLGRHPQGARPDALAQRLPLPLWRLHQGHAGVLRLRPLGPRPGHRLHLHDPGLAVPQLPAAHRADELPAPDPHRRGRHAAGVRLHTQHVLHHRRHHADGSGHQERHLAGGLCQPRPCGATKAKATTAPPCPAAKPCCWPHACACAPSS